MQAEQRIFYPFVFFSVSFSTLQKYSGYVIFLSMKSSTKTWVAAAVAAIAGYVVGKKKSGQTILGRDYYTGDANDPWDSSAQYWNRASATYGGHTWIYTANSTPAPVGVPPSTSGGWVMWN